MDPYEIATSLLGLVAEAEPLDIIVPEVPEPAQLSTILEISAPQQKHVTDCAKELLEELEHSLAESGWTPDQTGEPTSNQGEWTLGTAMTVRGLRREIHRGFIEPVRRVPMIRQVPDLVARFLISIDEGEEFLDRERHDAVGWHYHYLDWRKDRSNVVLCWDTRWSPPQTHTPSAPERRGLFVEEHGEKSNADFPAKPWLWGPTKRETMYNACSPDLQKWPIAAFRCASNKSEVVHPLSAKLTPHSSALVTKGTPKPNKAKRKRR